MPIMQWICRKQRRDTDRYLALSERLDVIESRLDKLCEEKSAGSPVVIEHADKVVVERLTYSNHFGTLEIGNLSGQLNIGVNCHGAANPPDELLPFLNKSAEGSAGSPPGNGGKDGPACNIRSRPSRT